MPDLLSKATELLERRFLLNAFLPVLVFLGSYATVLAYATGELPHLLHVWQSASTATTLLLIAGTFALCWFLAGIVASQWRNLIQLLEGWMLPGRLLTAWGRHASAAHVLEKKKLPREDTFYLYPEDEEDVLPTRLGNVLRSAEKYAYDRYAADTVLLWTRLGHLFPATFLANHTSYLASLEFLSVLTVGLSALSAASALTLAVTGHGALIFVVVLLGGHIFAYLAYLSAIQAAVQYGETLRAAFDMYRTELLVRMRMGVPSSLEDEQNRWRILRAFIEGDLDSLPPYSPAYIDIDPDRLFDSASASGSDTS
jgi:hypothetical protein